MHLAPRCSSATTSGTGSIIMYTHIHTHTHTHTRVYTYICINILMYVCVCVSVNDIKTGQLWARDDTEEALMKHFRFSGGLYINILMKTTQT